MKVFLVFLFSTFLLLAGCATTNPEDASRVVVPEIKKEHNKFEGTSSCVLGGLVVTTEENVQVMFNFTKSIVANAKERFDYFVSVKHLDFSYSDDFCLGVHLWFTIDDNKTIKLKIGSFVHGKYTQVTTFGSEGKTANLSSEDVKRIKGANKIKFEISACSHSKTKNNSVTGEISGENLKSLKDFFEQC